MNPLLSAGTKIVIFALVAYSIAIITEQKKRRITRTVIVFITFGIILDITATALMIAGSSNPPWTLHGMLGYSSLLAMFVDAFLMWRYNLKQGPEKEVSRGLHLYSRYAYIWWLMAFITGAAIVFLK